MLGPVGIAATKDFVTLPSTAGSLRLSVAQRKDLGLIGFTPSRVYMATISMWLLRLFFLFQYYNTCTFCSFHIADADTDAYVYTCSYTYTYTYTYIYICIYIYEREREIENQRKRETERQSESLTDF